MESKPVTILAIDDNTDNLTTITALIGESFPNAKVFTATSGHEGVAQACKHDPDVILLDIVMPEMDGFAVCLALKKDQRLQNIPVVFVTALKGDKENRIRALEVGGEGFLNKPIDESELAAQIGAMVKIKAAHTRIHDEKILLAEMVKEQTRELRKELQERKEVEEHLRKTQQMYTLLVNSIPDTSILLLDKDLRYQIVGGGEVEKSHFDKSKIIYRALREAYPKDVADLFEPLFRKALQGEPTTFEMPYAEFHYLQQVLPVRDEDGNVFATMQIASNITQRKRVEQEILNAHILLQACIESPKGIIIMAIDRDYRYLCFNNTHKTAMKNAYDKDVEIGINILDSISSNEDRQKAKTNYDRAMAGESHLTMEVYGDVQKSYYESFYNPIFNGQKEIIGITAYSIDITERKLSEENLHAIEARLRQSEKMEAIGQLAGGIAHDFNNILGGIIGFTDMSLEYAEKNSVLESNLKKVLQASDRAKHLVKQILTFSRQGNQQKSIISLYPIVNEVLELLKASIPSSVIIKSDLSKNTKPVVADPVAIHEMLLNLATNAVYAMGRKGFLTVNLNSVTLVQPTNGRIGTIEPGEYVVVEVIDTGSGMDPSILQKAFDPFYTTKPVGEGTGMGLSVVLGVVQTHKGDLQVESAPGSGTTFRVFLPLARGIETTLNDESAFIIKGGNERILFVDDEKVLVEMASEMLGELGYTVTCFIDSLEALKFIEQKSMDIDILVTDMTMPFMSGAELAKEALKIRNDLPVIICTGFSSEIYPELAATIGIRRFIMKPLRRWEFAAMLRDTLDNITKETLRGTNTRN